MGEWTRSSRRVLVIGGSGHVGRHVLACLRARGHEAEAGDPRVSSADTFGVCDAVVNAAGAGMSSDAGDSSALKMLEANVGVTLWCIRRAELSDTRLVHLGSLVETRNVARLDAYRDTKRMASAAVRLARSVDHLDAWILHPSLIYGGGRGIVDRMAAVLAGGRPFPLRQPDRQRDVIHVCDVALAVALAVEASGAAPDTEVAIGSGRPIRLREIADELARRFGAPFGWTRSDEPNPRPDADEVVDIEPARRALGFEAGIPLGAGLDSLVRELVQEGAPVV